MRTALLSFAFALLSLTPTFAQPQLVMQNEVVTSPSYGRSFDTAVFSDGSAAQLYKLEVNALDTLMLRKVDANGSPLWTVLVDTARLFSQFRDAYIEPLWDGSMIVAYAFLNRGNHSGYPRDLIIKRFATNGTLMWEFSTESAWPAAHKYLCDLTILGMDTIAVSGFYHRDHTHIQKYLLKVNAMSGLLLDQVAIVGEPRSGRFRISADISSVAVAYGYMEDSFPDFPAMVKVYTHDGNLLWSHHIENIDRIRSIMDVCLLNGTECFVLVHEPRDRYTLFRLDAQGNELWQRELIFPDGSNRGSITVWREELALLRWRQGEVQVVGGQGHIQWQSDLLNGGYRRHPVSVISDQDLLFGYSGYNYDIQENVVGVVQYHYDEQVLAGMADSPMTASTMITPVPFNVGLAYPNPFNSSTTLTLTTPTTGPVQVAVFDMLGRQVDNWSVPATNAGVVPITWSAHDLASGVYVIQLLTPDGHRATQRVTLVR